MSWSSAGVRRRAIDRKLRDVEALPDNLPNDIIAITAAEILEEPDLNDAAE